MHDYCPLNLIVAVARNGVIGNNGKLPWGHIPEDLARFRKITMGHIVVMGSKTFHSIGKALDGRTNIVLSNQEPHGRMAAQCIVEKDPDSVFKYAMLGKKIFIIGGAQIYKHFLPYVDTAYVTRIDRNFYGDTIFEDVPTNGENWRIIHSERYNDPNINTLVSFETLVRRS